MINFKDVTFIKSAPTLAERPSLRLPEIIMIGRSNVGKSSLINGLTGHKVAKVSSTPGKTVLLNYYLIDDKFYLVDAPGYGYAASGSRHTDNFAAMMEGYFEHNEELRLALLLLDSRRTPSQDDLDVFHLAKEKEVPHVVVLTKTDKLNQKETSAYKKMMAVNGYDKSHHCATSINDPQSYEPLKSLIAKAIESGLVAK